jgi:glycosyltransferase involved in cell wall biosynthesis
MPQAVTEATACGLPVVATRVGAIPEMVSDGVNGLLVPPRDPRALRAALESLLRNPELRSEMGRNGRAAAMKDYDAAHNNRSILTLMKSLVTDRAAAAQTA